MRVAVVVKVGEIVEGDGVGEVEQRALTVQQLPLDGGPVAPEKGADALKRLAVARPAEEARRSHRRSQSTVRGVSCSRVSRSMVAMSGWRASSCTASLWPPWP